MEKYFLIIVLLSLPLTTSAAFDTVQFTETTDIYLGNGLILQVLSGSKVAEMTVDSNSVTFNTVRSHDKKILTNNLNLHTSCFENYSEVMFNSNATQSFSITPDAGRECEEGRIGGQMVSPVTQLEGDETLDEQTTAKERATTEGKTEEGEITEGMAPGEALPEEKPALPGGKEALKSDALETKEDMSEKKAELDSTLIFGIIAAIVLSGAAAYYFLRKRS